MKSTKIELEIVIPVYNEEEALPKSIPKVMNFAEKHFKNYAVTIADNASVDKTPEVSKKLMKKYLKLRYLRLEEKGRGRALKKAWSRSDAKYLTYMDVDLSTGLNALPKLVEALKTNDIAIGSRFQKQSNVTRGLKREIFSRGYNYLLKMIFFTKIIDAQCGFKGITKKASQELIPLVENNNWFFDTELLLIAEKKGYKIAQIPVNWIEDTGSTVNIKKTVYEYFKEIKRMRKKLWKRTN